MPLPKINSLKANKANMECENCLAISISGNSWMCSNCRLAYEAADVIEFLQFFPATLFLIGNPASKASCCIVEANELQIQEIKHLYHKKRHVDIWGTYFSSNICGFVDVCSETIVYFFIFVTTKVGSLVISVIVCNMFSYN